jgi:hypothetical protein
VLIVDDELGIITKRSAKHIDHGVKDRGISRIQSDDVGDQDLHASGRNCCEYIAAAFSFRRSRVRKAVFLQKSSVEEDTKRV